MKKVMSKVAMLAITGVGVITPTLASPGSTASVKGGGKESI